MRELAGSAADLHVALAAVARAIAESLEIGEVWERVATACRTIAPFDAMGIVGLEGDQVRALGAAGDEQFRVLRHRSYPRSGFSQRLWPQADRFVVLIGDASTELDPAHDNDRRLVEAGYRSVLRVPLTTGSKRLGSVLLMSREPDIYTEQHAQTLLVVAELVTAALAHQELAANLAEEARRTAAAHERAAVLEERVHTLVRELEVLSPHRALGSSRRWHEVLTQATKVAATETTVLLTGESGTGKEVVARFIHRGSPRRAGPFVALNCAALPEQLLESELFGHERGAFTGAQTVHSGKIEQASGGVLFLDEVAEMSPSVQAKFLRVLQEREYQRLGSTRTLKADVRVLAATNRDLKSAIARGTFREDLYYRLAVFDIALPPLRERTEDIPLLVDAFLDNAARSVGHPAAGIADEARARLLEYRWPGNVRELRNVIERAVILCEGGLIRKEHLPLSVTTASEPAAASSGSAAPTLSGMTVDAAERELIVNALARSGNNKSKAARLLGLTRAQLRSRIEKHGLVVTDVDG
ncbi:MAG TPA: sigma 54-interacting transcriptional regulator [Steroidobacteraceae bacterium]|nr:sigma 54-interacting transcriptional regulator [Steroidobacteraceae bacterium]